MAGNLFSRRILKNYLYLVVGSVLGKAVGLAYLVYIARRLGAEQFGVISTAEVFLSYLLLLPNFGLPTVGTQELAAKGGISAFGRAYIAPLVSLRVFLALIALLVLYSPFASIILSPDVLPVAQMLGLALIANAVQPDWFFYGVERMEFSAIASGLRQCWYLLFALGFVVSPGSLMSVPLIRVSGDMVSALLSFGVLLVLLKGIKWRLGLKEWGRLLHASIPLGAAFVMIQIYYGFDTLYLERTWGSLTVGIYNAAYKPILFLIPLGTMFGSAIMPTIAREYQENRIAVSRLLSQTLGVICVVIVPMLTAMVFVAHDLVLLVFGAEYAQATIPLIILTWAVAFVYLGVVPGYALLGVGDRKFYLGIVSVAAILNIGLNLLLIPSWGTTAAALTTAIAEGTAFSLGMFRLRKWFLLSWDRGLLARVVAATLLLALTLAVAPQLQVILRLCLAATIYLGAFWLFLGKQERAKLNSALRPVKSLKDSSVL